MGTCWLSIVFVFAFLKLVGGTGSDLQLEEVTVVTLETDWVLVQYDKDSGRNEGGAGSDGER